MKTLQTINLAVSNKNVLRNGFVKLIDCMPRVIPLEAKKLNCDYAVVQAARVSYNEGLKTPDKDEKLIDYLFKHKHTSPFEMVKFKFHVKAPLFVARQWFRHRMASYNEISGRYTVLDEEMYNPIKVSSQSKENKQLSSNDDLTKDTKIKTLMDSYLLGASMQYFNYSKLMESGVSREIARIGLPLNLFTEFYFCIDLHNLLNFIKLRNSKNAQYEIKEYAAAIEELITPLCPITMNAFHKYKTVTLSQEQIKALDIYEFNYNKLKKREKDEICDLLNQHMD